MEQRQRSRHGQERFLNVEDITGLFEEFAQAEQIGGMEGQVGIGVPKPSAQRMLRGEHDGLMAKPSELAIEREEMGLDTSGLGCVVGQDVGDSHGGSLRASQRLSPRPAGGEAAEQQRWRPGWVDSFARKFSWTEVSGRISFALQEIVCSRRIVLDDFEGFLLVWLRAVG